MSTFKTRHASKAKKPPAPALEKPDPYQLVTGLIIGHLEKGVVPWRCPWSRDTGMPRNFHTGKAYRGVNIFLLGCRRAASPWWMTYRQARERGGHVRKGEHGALVVKYGTFERRDEETDDESVKRMFLRAFTVFNATQIEGIEFPEAIPNPSLSPKERIRKADSIAGCMPKPPLIDESPGARACYHSSRDEIEMPPYLSFESAETFYLTLYHEIAHATGHATRLNRPSLTGHDGFGGKVYSQEELVAEMCAAFVGMEADIVSDRHERSASYLNSWLQVLKVRDHRRWLVQAAGHASRAADYILGRVPEAAAESGEAGPADGEEAES